MIKKVYFQREPWGDVAIQHNDEVHHYNNLVSLIAFLQMEYGELFELVEVTEDNYHDLLAQGCFDDQ